MAEHPDDPATVNNVAQLLVRLGRASEAVPLLERVVVLDAREWSYQFNLGRARGLAGDWSGAVAAYETADSLFPDDVATLYNLGLALQRTGTDDRAVAALERAASAAPDDGPVVLALARSCQRLGRTAEATRAFTRFLELSPQSPDAAAARDALATLTGTQAVTATPSDGAARGAPPPG